MNLKYFFHLIHLFQRNPGSKMRTKYASPICCMRPIAMRLYKRESITIAEKC
jgi:hypothetical protein